MSTDSCPVCGATMAFAFSAVVLGKYDACYQSCPDCGFLRIRQPHWLDEAYASAIASLDTGIMIRNLDNARHLASILPSLSQDRGTFLDYAAGYGILVRLMRDRGFDFRYADRYASNLLARGFEYGPDDDPAIAVTAFEVMEHVEDPVGFVADALAAGKSDVFIFSTDLFAGDVPPLDWYYYVRDTGQHISFYRVDTLQHIARRLDAELKTIRGLHILSRRPIDWRNIERASRRGALAINGWRQRHRAHFAFDDRELLREKAQRSLPAPAGGPA